MTTIYILVSIIGTFLTLSFYLSLINNYWIVTYSYGELVHEAKDNLSSYGWWDWIFIATSFVPVVGWLITLIGAWITTCMSYGEDFIRRCSAYPWEDKTKNHLEWYFVIRPSWYNTPLGWVCGYGDDDAVKQNTRMTDVNEKKKENK